MYRPDLIFSYWIFTWYLLYIFGVIIYNPKFTFILGIIENIVTIILMIYYGTKMKIIILFIIILFLIKIIPLYTIWNTTTNIKDIKAFILIFLIYLFWYFIVNNKNISYLINLKKDLVLYNKINTPGIFLLNKLIFTPLKI